MMGLRWIGSAARALAGMIGPQCAAGRNPASRRALDAAECIRKARRQCPLHQHPGGRPRVATEPGRTVPKVTVIAWDLGHNPVGRAYLLADVLRRRYRVELIGANFPRFGKTLWEPLRGCSRVAVKGFPGRRFPGHFKDMQRVAEEIDGDVLYVSKPRLPGLELAILAKLHRNRPIVLDIDDYEPGFFPRREPLTLEEAGRRRGRADFAQPQDESWTRFAETLIPLCEQITVSNGELQQRYGGLVVPHVRDELDFEPSAWPRESVRSALGIAADERVIVFAGTPRLHKGLGELIAALERLRRHRCKLLVIGSAADLASRALLARADRELVVSVPDVPFSDLPGYLCAGDLVCLPQRVDQAVSRFQIPAKLTDALAMGIPVLASATPPMLPLAEEGLLEVLDAKLERKIEAVFDDYPAHRHRAEKNRSVFLQRFSYRAVLPALAGMIDGALAGASPAPRAFCDLVAYHRRVFKGGRSRAELRLLEEGQAGRFAPGGLGAVVPAATGELR